jgi:hypothetical protein
MGAEGQEHLWDKESKDRRTYNDIRIFESSLMSSSRIIQKTS